MLAPGRTPPVVPAARPPVSRGTALAATAGAVLLAGLAAVAGAPSAAAAPADQIRGSQQWVLDMLDVPTAWGTSQGAGVTVAVIDSGVVSGVSDLAGSVLAKGSKNETDLTTEPGDPKWGVHGTWMASIIAGHGHGGGSGIIGVAPQARLVSLRVIPDKGDPGYQKYGSEPESAIQQSLARGITDATAAGAKVISMSIGYSAPSSAVRAALKAAEQHGVVLVASSGNSGQSDAGSFAPVSFPAEYPGVLSVGAVNEAGAVASFSSDNLSVQVAAPGVNVPAQGRDGGYWLVSGTSPACALVAGVAALIKSRYPGLAPALVDRALTSTARHGKDGGYNEKSGFGTVDAAAALRAAGVLAGQRAGKSPVSASATFGGRKAVPAPPVKPRGAGQLIEFALLGLVALGLVAGGVIRLVILRRRPAPISYPAEPWAPAQYAAPGYPGQPYAGHGYAGQGYGGRGLAGQGYDRQSYDGRGLAGRGYEGQGYAGQGFGSPGAAGQGYDGQGYAGQGLARPEQAQQGHADPGHVDPGYPQYAEPPRYSGPPGHPHQAGYPQPRYPAPPQPPASYPPWSPDE